MITATILHADLDAFATHARLVSSWRQQREGAKPIFIDAAALPA